MRTTIYAIVTNDLHHDQRMHRICSSMQDAGYDVTLVGRKKKKSPDILTMPFDQHRLACYFQNGWLFYLEYNLRVLRMLLSIRPAIIYSVDADTLLATGIYKRWSDCKMIFDSHEWYIESPEIHDRKLIKYVWNTVENIFIPNADICFTINESIAKKYEARYQKQFTVLYNVGKLTPQKVQGIADKNPYILYQGVLNKGRGLESLLMAMEDIHDVQLMICGEGDISTSLRNIAHQSHAKDRIKFLGWQSEDQLMALTRDATLGINLLDAMSKSYYYSLANKFFDYMHAGVPSVNMDFPEYRNIISKYEVGFLIQDLKKDTIVKAINQALADQPRLINMKNNCISASQMYQWQKEESKLKEALAKLNPVTDCP